MIRRKTNVFVEYGIVYAGPRRVTARSERRLSTRPAEIRLTFNCVRVTGYGAQKKKKKKKKHLPVNISHDSRVCSCVFSYRLSKRFTRYTHP